MERKMWVVRSATCKAEDNEFRHFTNYGVFTSEKKAVEAMDRSYRLNKGTSWRQDDFRPDIFDYDWISHEGWNCRHRFILESHVLNRAW